MDANREDLEAAGRAFPVLPIVVDGKTYYVRTFTAQERAERIPEFQKLPDAECQERFCAFALCDAAGGRWYADDKLGGLSGANPVLLERISYFARRHNRLTKQDLDDLDADFAAARASACT